MAESATNVLPGWMNATMPAPMKTTTKTAWSSFHQPSASISTPISITPAAIATIPNRIEIALTDV